MLKKNMKTLRFLLEKEFKLIMRDKFMPKIIIVLPIVQLLILPLAANFEMKNINVSLVDRDRSVLSQKLAEKITSSGYFRITGSDADYGKAMSDIESNRSDLILEIPQGFEKDLKTENAATVMVSVNAVNGSKGGLASSYMASILNDFSESLNPPSVSGIRQAGIRTETSFLYNLHLSYKNYMVPGILVFLLTIICSVVSALNIVGEKENGTIEQMNVSPVSKSMFILSKLIPFWIIGFIVLTIGIAASYIVYGIYPAGSFAVIYAFAAVYILAFTGLGLLLSNGAATTQQAMFTAMFFIMIFLLLSGLFTPISSMPRWAQYITYLNPVRYFIEVMRMVFLKGSSFYDVLPQFAVICGFAVLANVLAVRTYRKSAG